MAWNRRSRPCLAVPPADSHSTRNNSQRSGCRSLQSASLPGSPPPSSAPLRRVRSRFFSSRRRHTRSLCDWSSDVCSSDLIREGYLAPHISAMLTLSDGQGLTFQWDKDNDTILPGPLAVKTVRFRVRRGVRFYYRHLSIQGLESLSQSEAQALFVETGFLVPLKSTRIYTPSGLERSIGDLTEALARKGFEHASVKV